MTSPTLASVLEHLTNEPITHHFDAYSSWKENFIQTSDHLQPWLKAIKEGFQSDCIGYVFSAGYQCALQALAPSLPANQLAAFCVTEENGNHPRAIQTNITSDTNTVILNGAKKFISGGVHADILLVATKTHEECEGRPVIKLIKVDSKATGVQVNKMPTLPFVPEVDHATVAFENVKCTEDSILPGDGYADYVKPFRTIEDTYVSLSVCSYLLKICLTTKASQPLIEEALNLVSLHQQLTEQEASSHITHLLLSGARIRMKDFIPVFEEHWSSIEDPAYSHWLRDKALLQVAKEARVKRTEAAWKKLKE